MSTRQKSSPTEGLSGTSPVVNRIILRRWLLRYIQWSLSLSNRGGKNEMPSFHYANFAGSLLPLMNCYSICRWTLPTCSQQIWHTIITCPIFLCYIVASSAYRNTAYKIETKVPKGFSLPKVKSVSSSKAKKWEANWWCLLSFKQSQKLGSKQGRLLPFLSYSSDQARQLLPFCVGIHL